MLDPTIVLLALSVCFGLLATYRLLVLRFPHPLDLAIVSVLYYSLPLALLATVIGDSSGNVLLNLAAADPQIALRSMQYALLACVSAYAGLLVAKLLSRSTPRLRFALLQQDEIKTHIFALLLLGLIVLGIILFGPATYFSGYNVESQAGSAASGTALIYSSIEMLGLVIAYSFLISRGLNRRPNYKLIGIIMLALLSLAVVRGKRLEIISAFLPLGILIFATSRFFGSTRGRLLSVLGAAVLISMMASLRFGEMPTPASIAFNLVSEGLFAGHSLPGVIERLNAGQLEYEYGARIGAGLLAVIPRFVWPSKDELLYTGDEALKDLSPLGATNILAEVVLQGGAIAVILWFLCVGFVFERVYQSLHGFDAALAARRLPAMFIVYLVIMCSFIPHFRDGLVPAMKISLQTLIFFFVISGIRLLPSPTWIIRRLIPMGRRPIDEPHSR